MALFTLEERMKKVGLLTAILLFFACIPSTQALIAYSCHDGRIPCMPRADLLEIAGEEYRIHLSVAFTMDETMGSVTGSGTGMTQMVVIELIKKVRDSESTVTGLESQNFDLVQENMDLRMELEKLQKENKDLSDQITPESKTPECIHVGGIVVC